MAAISTAEMGLRGVQRRVLAAVSISYVMVVLDSTIVNVALQRISSALSTNIAGLQWVVNAYVLAFASLLLTGGTLGDRWGARNIYLAGLAVFTLASALCGLAPSLLVLTIARVVQGIGAAMLVPCSLTLLNHAYPDPGERAAAIGVFAGYGGAAIAAGPLVGGFLIDLLGWRSMFLVNVPVGLLGVWMTLRISDHERASQGRHFDLAGQIAAILALGTSIAVLIEGPTLGWASPSMLAGMTVAVASWIAFLTIETRRAEPMMPLSFFKNGLFSGSAIATITTAIANYGLFFLLSLYFQRVRGYSPLMTGLAFLPLTAVVTAASMVSGRWTKARGARWPVLVGLALTAIGFLGLLPADPTTPYWLVGLPMMANGVGSGLLIPSATSALMGTVEKSRAGIASGVLNSARQTGSALGVAVTGALLATLQPFEAGMQAVLWIAAAVQMLALVCWFIASRQRGDG